MGKKLKRAKKLFRGMQFADLLIRMEPYAKSYAKNRGYLLPELKRTARDSICHICRLAYGAHPFDTDYLYQGQPFLRRTCDGTLIIIEEDSCE